MEEHEAGTSSAGWRATAAPVTTFEASCVPPFHWPRATLRRTRPRTTQDSPLPHARRPDDPSSSSGSSSSGRRRAHRRPPDTRTGRENGTYLTKQAIVGTDWAAYQRAQRRMGDHRHLPAEKAGVERDDRRWRGAAWRLCTTLTSMVGPALRGAHHRSFRLHAILPASANGPSVSTPSLGLRLRLRTFEEMKAFYPARRRSRHSRSSLPASPRDRAPRASCGRARPHQRDRRVRATPLSLL